MLLIVDEKGTEFGGPSARLAENPHCNTRSAGSGLCEVEMSSADARGRLPVIFGGGAHVLTIDYGLFSFPGERKTLRGRAGGVLCQKDLERMMSTDRYSLFLDTERLILKIIC